MLTRQKVALRILQGCGGAASYFTLTKLMFLLGEESPTKGGSAFYRFVPYHFGPYSFSLHYEVGQLERDGMLTSHDGRSWNLTAVGLAFSPALPIAVERDIRLILTRYARLGFDQLTDTVYARYPWFTALAQREERRVVARPVADLAVYTMGYEGLHIERFMDRLLRQGILRVIDVRNNPTSRRYGFHQSTLTRISGNLGLHYLHLPELGIPSAQRVSVRQAQDYIALLDRYETETLSREKRSVARLADTLSKEPGVLVCMEAEPERCHRSRLARVVAPLAGLPVVHLGGEP